jgi:hypothetical protein
MITLDHNSHRHLVKPLVSKSNLKIYQQNVDTESRYISEYPAVSLFLTGASARYGMRVRILRVCVGTAAESEN